MEAVVVCGEDVDLEADEPGVMEDCKLSECDGEEMGAHRQIHNR